MNKIKERTKLKEFRELVKEYKERDKRIGINAEMRELTQKIATFVHDYAKDLVPEILYERFLKNLSKKKNKKNKEITFLSKPKDIKQHITDPVFPVKLKNKISSEIDAVIIDIPQFDPQNFVQTESYSYYIEIITDPYTYSKYKSYFYFDSFDNSVIEGYLNNIYRDTLIPFLKTKYNQTELFNAVNSGKFAVCSPDDFLPENCIKSIARKNISNLVNKIIDLISAGTKFIDQSEIVDIYELRLILDMTSVTLPEEQRKEETKQFKESIEVLSPEDQIVEQIKEKFRILLKNSVKASNEYIGFFTKEDYIKWLLPKYREVGYDKLEEIFNKVVNPKPPTGVIKFVVPAKSGETYYYFISIEEVPAVFSYMVGESKTKKFEDYSNIKKTHFFMFIKKIFKDFRASNFDDSRIAKYFGTDLRKIQEMRRYIEKMD